MNVGFQGYIHGSRITCVAAILVTFGLREQTYIPVDIFISNYRFWSCLFKLYLTTKFSQIKLLHYDKTNCIYDTVMIKHVYLSMQWKYFIILK